MSQPDFLVAVVQIAVVYTRPEGWSKESLQNIFLVIPDHACLSSLMFLLVISQSSKCQSVWEEKNKEAHKPQS